MWEPPGVRSACRSCTYASNQIKCKDVHNTVTSLEDQVSFLQIDYPSPLSKAFKGDVSFIVDDTEVIQAHRFILASKSPIFKTMMEADMKESISGKICIVGISAAVVQAVVNFMYRGVIQFTDEVTPLEVIKFAHQYDISWLKHLCEAALVKTITNASLVELFSISYTYEADTLKNAVKKFFTDNPTCQGNALDVIFNQLLGGFGRKAVIAGEVESIGEIES